MHLHISESYFVCAVSLRHSIRLCKPHLVRHKYIISRRSHWMPLIIRIILITKPRVYMRLRSLPALSVPLAIKGSARNRQDVTLTGRSPIQAGHVRNCPIPITGRSIGASLVTSLAHHGTVPHRRFDFYYSSKCTCWLLPSKSVVPTLLCADLLFKWETHEIYRVKSK